MAGSGVNIKMGVSGVAQFKQNIRTAQQSVKTLDEQLKLNEKQFKATGDSQDYMATKTALLQKKIEEQKAIVSQAERALAQMSNNGVDKASDAFQKMQQQLLRAKGDLLDAETSLANISDSGDEAADGVSEMNSQLQRIGKDVGFETVTNGLDKITSGLENVAKKAYQAGSALVNATLGAGEWADELVTTASKYSTAEHTITPEQLQRMRYTATVIDTDVDTIISAQKKLRKAMSDTSSEETMGAFAALGIDPTGKDWQDVFWQAGEALKGLSDVQQEAYVTKLFGRNWDELKPLFEAGRDKYNERMESWTVVSDSAIEKLTTMNDKQEELNNAWTTTQNTLLATLAGPLTSVMEKLTNFLTELNTYLESEEGQQKLGEISNTITTLLDDLTNVDPSDVLDKVKEVLGKIVDSLKWVSEHHGEVVDGLKAIVIGWAGLKLTGGALQMFNLLNGLGLIGGKAAADAAVATASSGTASGLSLAGLGTALGSVTAVAGQLALAGYSGWGLVQNAKGWLYGYEQDEYHEGIDENERIMREEWERMNQVSEESASQTVRSTSEMTQAANGLQGLPALIRQAVVDGMGSVTITIDGVTAGNVLAPHVGNVLGDTLLMMSK